MTLDILNVRHIVLITHTRYHLASIHEFQNSGEVHEWNVLQNDDRVLGRVLLKQILEVRATGAENLRKTMVERADTNRLMTLTIL